MLVQVLGVQNPRELRATVLRHGAEILVQIVEGVEFGVPRRLLVRVARLIDNADGVALVRRLLQQRQEMRGKDYMPHMVQRHMPIDSVICELVRHDPSRGIIEQDIDSIRRTANLFRDLSHALPIAQVTLDPLGSVGLLLSHLRSDGVDSAFDNIFGDAEDVQFRDIAGEESMCDTVADALA